MECGKLFFLVGRLLSALRRLPSAVRRLPSAVRGLPSAVRGLASVLGRKSLACRRWEHRVYLHASGDLDEGEANLLERHLQSCARCRGELEAVRRLRERCLEVPAQRGSWAGLEVCLEDLLAAASSPLIPPAGTESPPRRALSPVSLPARGLRMSRGLPGGRGARLAALVLLFVGAACLSLLWVKVASAPSQEARWAGKWKQFVSGAFDAQAWGGAPAKGGGGGPVGAPAEIPNPEVIEF